MDYNGYYDCLLGSFDGIHAADKDIQAEEKDLAELEEQIVKEDNERKINEIYRKIKAVKSKIDMLSVRKSNYSACYNLLDKLIRKSFYNFQSFPLLFIDDADFQLKRHTKYKR